MRDDKDLCDGTGMTVTDGSNWMLYGLGCSLDVGVMLLASSSTLKGGSELKLSEPSLERKEDEDGLPERRCGLSLNVSCGSC